MPYAVHASVSIYYETFGELSGAHPAVVFAHGAGGNRLSWWQQVPVFAERHRVLAFDHRGFGRSACAVDEFHPRHFADDLRCILDAAGVDRAALVCQSMGGWTGLRLAVEHPERVAALVLCGTPGGLMTREVLDAMRRIGQRTEGEGIRANAALAPDYPRRRPDMTLLYDQINGLNPGLPPAALARLGDERARIDPARLEGYAVPTLLVAGQHDALFPPEALREVQRAIPGSEWCEIPRAGHSTYFEEPQRFNEVVADFLARHP